VLFLAGYRRSATAAAAAVGEAMGLMESLDGSGLAHPGYEIAGVDCLAGGERTDPSLVSHLSGQHNFRCNHGQSTWDLNICDGWTVYIVWGKVPHDPREPRLWGVCSAGMGEENSKAGQARATGRDQAEPPTRRNLMG
jgi:hypothetical protein